MESENLQYKVDALLRSQKLAVLATQDNDRPYTSLVAFSFTDDLKSVFFVTARATRKYDNLVNRPRTALLVDNRQNTGDDFQHAVAVTILGDTREVEKAAHAADIEAFLQRHPPLREFVEKDTSAFFAVDVTTYIYVSNFGDVAEYRP
ncbi:MAG: pyridoxamine 5'-phosphate oxidase family protein [Spartobacteria bacterium]|nr:pyridoxamine 5'-phosphate oxidase family protein [Spartobacteria bacterium]